MLRLSMIQQVQHSYPLPLLKKGLKEMAATKGVSATTLVVAWLTSLHRIEGNPRVIPLFASSNVEHFAQNLDGAELYLSDEELAALTNA